MKKTIAYDVKECGKLISEHDTYLSTFILHYGEKKEAAGILFSFSLVLQLFSIIFLFEDYDYAACCLLFLSLVVFMAYIYFSRRLRRQYCDINILTDVDKVILREYYDSCFIEKEKKRSVISNDENN